MIDRTLLGLSIIEQMKGIAQQIEQLSEAEAIEVLNEVRLALHEVSPFKEHPVDYVQWVPETEVVLNDYNPNVVSPPEMELLERSIQDNGFAMPIVIITEKEQNVVVDGAHRHIVSQKKAIRQQLKGYLPVARIRPGRGELTARMAATIQFNVHGEATIDGLSNLVLDLSRRNWSDERIAKELGMELDKVLRLKQQMGLAELFRDGDFSKAWTIEENEAGETNDE